MKKLTFLLGMALVAVAAEWSAPVDVLHELKPCVTYKAKLDGDFLVIEAAIQPGWHTFAIDNEQRAAEKRGGKPSLGIDQPTQISLGKGLELAGPWYQLPPKDFSKPQLRWYTFGYEQKAVFAAKVKRSGSGPAPVGVHGQACTETTCKNIDVSLAVPLAPAGGTGPDLKSLVQVKQ